VPRQTRKNFEWRALVSGVRPAAKKIRRLKAVCLKTQASGPRGRSGKIPPSEDLVWKRRKKRGETNDRWHEQKRRDTGQKGGIA